MPSVYSASVSQRGAGTRRRAIPFPEDPQHGRRGFEPLQGVVAPEQQRAEMPAISQ